MTVDGHGHDHQHQHRDNDETGRAVDEAGGLLRQAQAHQQPVGRQRPCKYLIITVAKNQTSYKFWFPGDFELNAQVPAAVARDLHQPSRGGSRRHRELSHFHLPGDQVHCRHRLPESQGEALLVFFLKDQG